MCQEYAPKRRFSAYCRTTCVQVIQLELKKFSLVTNTGKVFCCLGSIFVNPPPPPPFTFVNVDCVCVWLISVGKESNNSLMSHSPAESLYTLRSLGIVYTFHTRHSHRLKVSQILKPVSCLQNRDTSAVVQAGLFTTDCSVCNRW